MYLTIVLLLHTLCFAVKWFNQTWLIRMLELPIADKAFLRLIKKWLKAGILDKDAVKFYRALGVRLGKMRRENA